jgi:hypothetical protein
VIDPDKPFFMYPLRGVGAPHQVFGSGPQVQGSSTRAMKPSARAFSQKKLGLLPDDTELSSINPPW